MSLGGFERMQVMAIVHHLRKYPQPTRVEMFKMILDEFCITCGREKKPGLIPCHPDCEVSK